MRIQSEKTLKLSQFKEVFGKSICVVHQLVDSVVHHPEVCVVPALLLLPHPAAP